MITITVNDEARTVDAAPDTPLLWVLRDELGMTGTKYGCGMGLCGACTVHMNGQAIRSCVMPVGALEGAQIKTIEGLSPDRSHPVQQAWLAQQVPQCGYCQSGMIMAAAALLERIPKPTDADIKSHVDNLCRCGTYQRVVRAVHQAAQSME